MGTDAYVKMENLSARSQRDRDKALVINNLDCFHVTSWLAMLAFRNKGTAAMIVFYLILWELSCINMQVFGGKTRLLITLVITLS